MRYLCLWLHKPHASHHTAARFTSAVFNSGPHCLVAASNLPTLERWKAWWAVPALGVEPAPSDSWGVKLEARDLTHSATQTRHKSAPMTDFGNGMSAYDSWVVQWRWMIWGGQSSTHIKFIFCTFILNIMRTWIMLQYTLPASIIDWRPGWTTLVNSTSSLKWHN